MLEVRSKDRSLTLSIPKTESRKRHTKVQLIFVPHLLHMASGNIKYFLYGQHFSWYKLEHFENHSLAWKVAYHLISNTNGSSSQTEIYQKDDLWWFSLSHLSVSTRTEMELWLQILKKNMSWYFYRLHPDIEWPFSTVNFYSQNCPISMQIETRVVYELSKYFV